MADVQTGGSLDDAAVILLQSDEDVVRLRLRVRQFLMAAAFSLVEQTKVITAVSELARNAVTYGGGGESQIAQVANGTRLGVRIRFTDRGPGIPDIALALTDGYTTGGGLGLGLSGAKRLCDEFEIESAVGRGTTVVITKWKRA